MGDCKLCQHADRKSIEEAIANGSITKTMVAQDLGCKPADIFEHMDKHWTKFSEIKEQPKTAPGQQKLVYVNKHDLLMNNCAQIQDKLQAHLSADDISPAHMKTMLSLAQEVRHSITALAELEGEIKKEQNITLNFYNELKVTIFSNLCGECKNKVLAVLQKQEKELEESNKRVAELLVP